MDTDRADLGDQRTSGAATYSVQAHPDDSAPGTLLISYAVNGGGQYYPNFISISP